jgi:nucleoside-diphosphate-sugar epimerase
VDLADSWRATAANRKPVLAVSTAVQPETHVVIGGSGASGRVVVRLLAQRGVHVRAVSRRGNFPVPPGVETIGADATDADRMREVCAGATVVYHCAMPPFRDWRRLFPPMTDAMLAGAEAAGARLVFADDTWMYGAVDRPMTEDLPSRPVSDRGVLRAWLAEKLLRAHDQGRVPVAIARAGELYGPAVESVLARGLFGAASAGRRARWFGNLDLPITPTYIEDFGRGLVTLGEHPDVVGRAWHVPTEQPTTGRDFVRAVFDEAGTSGRVTAISARTARALGLVSPLAREGAAILYQFEQPFIVDSGNFARRFDVTPTPYRDGIRATLDWYRAGGSPRTWSGRSRGR